MRTTPEELERIADNAEEVLTSDACQTLRNAALDLKEAREREQRYLGLFSHIKSELSVELNMSNYNEDDVSELNQAGINAWIFADNALKLTQTQQEKL